MSHGQVARGANGIIAVRSYGVVPDKPSILDNGLLRTASVGLGVVLQAAQVRRGGRSIECVAVSKWI